MNIENKINLFLNETIRDIARQSKEIFSTEITDLFLDYYEGSKGYENVNPEKSSDPIEAENNIDDIENKLKGSLSEIIKKIYSKVTDEDNLDKVIDESFEEWAKRNKNVKGVKGDLAKMINKSEKDKEKIIKIIKSQRNFQHDIKRSIEKYKEQRAKEIFQDIQKDFNKEYNEFQSEIDNDKLIFSTREHGNVANEEPGKEDMKRAKKLASEIKRKYKNMNAIVDTVDEFTEVIISMK